MATFSIMFVSKIKREKVRANLLNQIRISCQSFDSFGELFARWRMQYLVEPAFNFNENDIQAGETLHTPNISWVEFS